LQKGIEGVGSPLAAAFSWLSACHSKPPENPGVVSSTLTLPIGRIRTLGRPVDPKVPATRGHADQAGIDASGEGGVAVVLRRGQNAAVDGPLTVQSETDADVVVQIDRNDAKSRADHAHRYIVER
jgi:hypothetical protein